MSRLIFRTVLAVMIAMDQLSAAAAATRAECWEGINRLNARNAEIDEAIARHKQTKTDTSRCEMLAIARKQAFQKMETSKTCYEFMPAQAAKDIAKTKLDLRELDSPKLRCNRTPAYSRADHKCSRDGDAMESAAEAMRSATERMKSDKSQTCAFVKSARKFISASVKFADSCKHHDQVKMSTIRADMAVSRENLEKKARLYPKGCR